MNRCKNVPKLEEYYKILNIYAMVAWNPTSGSLFLLTLRVIVILENM